MTKIKEKMSNLIASAAPLDDCNNNKLDQTVFQKVIIGNDLSIFLL
ncbi:MAG TPA: hypothetical protein VLA74_05705 [Nitrososphaeraceae archaeon]|nr:hypothetical protein [Nitrososphaeraceae archaeon]